MKKKIVLWIMTALMTCSLAACGSASDDQGVSGSQGGSGSVADDNGRDGNGKRENYYDYGVLQEHRFHERIMAQLGVDHYYGPSPVLWRQRLESEE